jgi:putative spermidine/putrescine transport system ATP-binding protein
MMLLDEPLAALDKHLRESMQLELRRLQQRVGITTVAVTHDQVEALTMADRVAVMCDGHVEQVASPEELYLRPATFFVATFLGEANLVPVDGGELAGFGRLPHDVSGQAVIRPEHLTLQDGAPTAASELTAAATVEEVTFQGPRRRVRLRLRSAEDTVLTFAQPSTSAAGGVEPGGEVTVALDASAVHVIPGEGSPPDVAEEGVLTGRMTS